MLFPKRGKLVTPTFKGKTVKDRKYIIELIPVKSHKKGVFTKTYHIYSQYLTLF